MVPFRPPGEIAASFRWRGEERISCCSRRGVSVSLVAFFTISHSYSSAACLRCHQQAFLVDSIPVIIVVVKTGFAHNPRTLKLVFSKRGSLVRNYCHEASGLA